MLHKHSERLIQEKENVSLKPVLPTAANYGKWSAIYETSATNQHGFGENEKGSLHDRYCKILLNDPHSCCLKLNRGFQNLGEKAGGNTILPRTLAGKEYLKVGIWLQSGTAKWK